MRTIGRGRNQARRPRTRFLQMPIELTLKNATRVPVFGDDVKPLGRTSQQNVVALQSAMSASACGRAHRRASYFNGPQRSRRTLGQLGKQTSTRKDITIAPRRLQEREHRPPPQKREIWRTASKLKQPQQQQQQQKPNTRANTCRERKE